MPGIFDISMILSEHTPIFPGDPEFKSESFNPSKDEEYTITKITMGSHTGTHIDSPSHIYPDKANIYDIPLDLLIGKCMLVEFSNDEFISSSDLKSLNLDNYDRILFKTPNSAIMNAGRFTEDYVYITQDAAQYLVKKGIRLIGFDYYTIDKYNSDLPAHKELLKNDVTIIEGLNLTTVDAGEYELIALPLKLKTEGAPARVVLRQFTGRDIT